MLTAGQHQALSELKAVERRSRRKVTSGSVLEETFAGDPYITVPVTVDCSDTPAVPPHGVALDPAETFNVLIPRDYPYSPPYADATDDRFAGLPHVMWSNGVCLYASRNDWNPSAGMLGFVRRLLEWLARTADGSIVGPVLPWHPPVGAGSHLLPPLVIPLDLPDEYERDSRLWICWAAVDESAVTHLRLRGWHATPDAAARDFTAVPVVGLPHAVGFLFPTGIDDLTHLLASQGLPADEFLEQLRQAWEVNGGATPMVLLGSPAPARAGTGARIANLSAWCAGSEDGEEAGTEETPVYWFKVFDQRPSVVTRRDVSRPVTWLAGKRVLVLGCGALGAPIAEHCVRAGVAAVRLVDNGGVSPGILVRQPYRHHDIGQAKATATAERLQEIRPDAAVEAEVLDATQLECADLADVDLLIDATANQAVAERLEALRRQGPRPHPPSIAVMVGHDCARGVVTIALPASSGGGVDVQRQLAVAAFGDGDLQDLREDFYPSTPRTEVFQPEPGCSDPTFVGSAADLAGFAARLLNAAVAFVSAGNGDLESPPGGNPTRAAVVIRSADAMAPEPPPRLLQWPNDIVLSDSSSGYEIRIAQQAWSSMRREAIRATHLERQAREAGGYLIGQVDPACRVIWVTTAVTGIGVDDASARHVRLDPAQVREPLIALFRRTKGVLGFVGAWHNHPWSDPVTSKDDLDAMNEIVNAPDGGVPVALLMILGGRDEVWDNWLRGTRRPAVHVQTYFTDTD